MILLHRMPRPTARPRSGALLMAILAGLAAVGARQAAAQGVRGWVGTTIQAVELRPIGLDTIPFSSVTPTENGGFTFEGVPIACLATRCTRYRALAEDRTIAASQDVSLTAWGFGVQGLSATTLLRGRARLGGDLIWPRSDDEFDALLAYAQLIRGRYRIRAGRQEVRSGLGFPAFDGGSVVVGAGALRGEAYGGRSLARGLREPANEALRGLESFLPDESAWLLGLALEGRLAATAFTGRYHREIYGDRGGLVSERASLDVTTVLSGARLSAALDYDFGFGQLGKSHLTLTLPALDGRATFEVAARRYVPYFELSTIWGFFQPVAYSEALARVGWTATETLGLWASGGWRSYGDAEATVVLRPLDDHGWRADMGAAWTPVPGWSLRGSYQVERGPGAFLSSGDVSARWAATEELGVSASVSSFQQIEEFRVGDGRAYGAGLSFDWTMSERTSLAGGWSLLRHHGEGSTFNSPWNQGRGWTALRVGIGSDPGMRARSGS